MMARLSELIKDWDTVLARNIRRGYQGLNDADQATMLDVAEILSQKGENFPDQSVIRCWLKDDILPREDVNALKNKDPPLDREDKEDTAIIENICDIVAKMTIPASVMDARSMPRVLTDILFAEKQPGLTDAQMREAIETQLNVTDDLQVLDDEVKLELHAVDEDLANLDVEDHVSGKEEDRSGRPESCITSSIP